MTRYRVYDHDGLIEETDVDDDSFVDFLLDLLADRNVDVLTVEEDEEQKRQQEEEDAEPLCEWCNEGGTAERPVNDHITSPPLDGHPVECGHYHDDCAAQMTAERYK